MDIQAIGASATVAFFCAVVFILAIKSWHQIARVLSGNPSFADSIMSESAERFREELQALSRRQSMYFGALVVFALMFVAAGLLGSPALFAGYPEWQLYVVFLALLAAALFVACRLGRTILRWRRTRFLHDANLAIGHQLQRIAAEHGCAFHDVPTQGGIIDHVLVGQNGIYAVTVIARRHWRKGQVRLDDNELRFSPSERPMSLVNATAGARRLARECRHMAGRPVRVRSVVAVPGWEVAEQTGLEHLLVNERNLAMMRGWRDQGDYLMDEEAAAIREELTRRCSRQRKPRKALKAA